MNVSELIEVLGTLPQDATVLHLWDGEARTEINHAWLSKDGKVITADYGMVCYSSETRPVDAPGGDQRYWETPRDPAEDNEDA